MNEEEMTDRHSLFTVLDVERASKKSALKLQREVKKTVYRRRDG